MEAVLLRYYKVNAYLFLAIGFRFFRSSWILRVQRTIILLILLCGLVSQSLTIVMLNPSMASLLRRSPPTIINAIFLLKHGTVLCKWKQINHIFEQMTYDWKCIVDEEERKIMRERLKAARTYTFMFLGLSFPPAILATVGVIVPRILDIVTPINQTRSSFIEVDIGYVLDSKKYPNIYALDTATVIVVGVAVVNSFELALLAAMQHAITLFRIASYRLQKAVNEPASSQAAARNRNFGDQSTLAGAISMHARALAFCEYMRTNFMVSYGVLLSFGTLSLSVCLYRMSQVRVCLEEMSEVITLISVLFGNLGYAFYINHVVQLAVEESDTIFYNAYNSHWYDTTVSVQKQLQFVMCRSCEGFTCDLWNLYKPSLQGFALIVKTSFSYFMVIRSV